MEAAAPDDALDPARREAADVEARLREAALAYFSAAPADREATRARFEAALKAHEDADLAGRRRLL